MVSAVLPARQILRYIFYSPLLFFLHCTSNTGKQETLAGQVDTHHCRRPPPSSHDLDTISHSSFVQVPRLGFRQTLLILALKRQRKGLPFDISTYAFSRTYFPTQSLPCPEGFFCHNLPPTLLANFFVSR